MVGVDGDVGGEFDDDENDHVETIYSRHFEMYTSLLFTLLEAKVSAPTASLQSPEHRSKLSPPSSLGAFIGINLQLHHDNHYFKRKETYTELPSQNL